MQLGHPLVRQILALVVLSSAIVYSQNVTFVEDKPHGVSGEVVSMKDDIDPAVLAEFEHNLQSANLRAFPLLAFIALCVSSASLAVSSMSLYSALNPGRCGVCIERNTRLSGAINMNFEDVAGEGNWNLERFSVGLQRDCTNERISGNKQLHKVQFFDNDDVHCVCRIHISCHKDTSGFDRAWVNLDGDFLTNHWLRTWPGGNPTKNYCPAGCVMLSKIMDGMHGMNVMNEALSCSEHDNECKHRYVHMWD